MGRNGSTITGTSNVPVIPPDPVTRNRTIPPVVVPSATATPYATSTDPFPASVVEPSDGVTVNPGGTSVVSTVSPVTGTPLRFWIRVPEAADCPSTTRMAPGVSIRMPTNVNASWTVGSLIPGCAAAIS